MPADAVAELERLAFVPPDAFALPALDGVPIVGDNLRALLVDRCEVTRGEWRDWLATQAARDPLLEAWVAAWPAGASEDWPATFMTLDEARTFAGERGMRLLTAREWLRIACGPRRQPWPWGSSAHTSVANTLELGLGRPVAVGTFEQGRTPLAVFDLLGNVWEWVEEPIHSVAPAPRAADGDLAGLPPSGASAASASFAWAMGGSYLAWPRRLFEIVEEVDPGSRRAIQRWSFYQQDLHPLARSSDVGLRCAADAEEYLWRTAPRLDGAERARLRGVGRAWGSAAIPLLERLCERPAAPIALRHLLEGART